MSANQNSTCVACGPTRASAVTTKEPFRIVQCEQCSLIYVDGASALQGLERFYDNTYFSSDGHEVCGYRDYVADRYLHLRNAEALLATIERSVVAPGRQLLDVGCAYGFFLDAARARGWRAFGVDVAPEAVKYARERLRLPVYEGGAEDVPFEPESFDAVSMIGTIEHLPDPLRALRAAARLLRPNGLLVVTTIDVEGRLGYFSWKPPEHLYYFSFRTLSLLIQKAGLSLASKRTYWTWYRASDLAARLWAYRGLPGGARFAMVVRRLQLDRLSLKIPTNEVLVIARKLSPS